jgi:prevent-host-death family protein
MELRVPISALRARLPEMLRRLDQGDQVLITRRGQPVAELAPFVGVRILRARRRPKAWRAVKGPGTMSAELLEERRREI